MTTLLLRLAGPLQSWGDSSRFAQRQTRRAPTKSGVMGLLASAQGRRRTDPVEDLVNLEFVVRIDQPGSVIRDFHTAIDWRSGQSMPLSQRYYLADAAFVAGVSGDAGLIGALAAAVRSPVWAPFLGRRSCPPAKPVFLSVVSEDVRAAVRAVPWQAAAWHRRAREGPVLLPMRADARPEEIAGETACDVPQSYDPQHRSHGWRGVVELDPVVVPGAGPTSEPDFMSTVEA